MSSLNREAKPGEFDKTYNALLQAFSQFPSDQQLEFSALLLVILCNHIGDKQVIDEALALANKMMISTAGDEPDNAQGDD